MNIISQNQSSQYNNRSDKVVVIPLCAACHLLKLNAKIGGNMRASFFANFLSMKERGT